MELVSLVSEVQLDLRVRTDKMAKGTVLEAKLNKNTGPTTTLLVQNGTLKKGDIVLAGIAYGKVKSLVNDHKQQCQEATPSYAIQMLGLNAVPSAGDIFEVCATESEVEGGILICIWDIISILILKLHKN